jgi:hypothetical protein
MVVGDWLKAKFATQQREAALISMKRTAFLVQNQSSNSFLYSFWQSFFAAVGGWTRA